MERQFSRAIAPNDQLTQLARQMIKASGVKGALRYCYAEQLLGLVSAIKYLDSTRTGN